MNYFYVIKGIDAETIKKIAMRINVLMILMTIFLLKVSASVSMAQTVTLNRQNAPLKEILTEIEKQTGYAVFTKSTQIKKARPVTIHLSNVPLDKAMTKILEGQELDFSIDEKTIVIKEKMKGMIETVKDFFTDGSESPQPEPQQHITVTGRVADSLGRPIAGATIRVLKGKGSTSSGANGTFTLANVSTEATLQITAMGYAPKEIQAATQLGVVVLLVSKSPLDEVQVIAYGTTSKRFSTGNIGTVSAEEIERQPVNNVLLALSAKVPGLFISQANGIPGSGVTVRIQGTNSMSSGNDPLYIIDGVPYVSQLLPSVVDVLGRSGGARVNGASDNGGGNPLSYINPIDIESISILKDADATAIYGSRAANGAVLIMTKRGKPGNTQVSVTFQNGWGKVARKINLLNTQQYLQMRREAKMNDNLPINSTDYDLNGFWDSTRNTDWQKELIGGTAQYRDGQISISGGNINTQFNLGGGYHRETTVFPGDFGDTKGSMHFNINSTSNNQKFKVQLTGNYMHDNNKFTTTDLTNNILLAPNAPSLYATDGSINWMPDANGASTWTNPLSYLLNTYNLNSDNLVANSILSYKISSEFELSTNLGYNNLYSKEKSAIPLEYFAPETQPFAGRYLTVANSKISSWIIEPQLTYHRKIGMGKFEGLIGATFNERRSERDETYGSGFNSNLVLENMSAASTITVGPSLQSLYAYNSVFARLNYNFKDQYIVNLTGRRDGSSRFGSKNRYHKFGAIGAGLVFSEYSFMKSQVPWLGFGKLRVSYGTTGNDQIGNYAFLNLYSSVTTGNAYQGIPSLVAKGLPNPYVQWEETKKLQFGLDLQFLQDKFFVTVNYFQNRSSNQLLNNPLPSLAGFGSIISNLPATVQNKGWEFNLNTTNAKSSIFSWTSNINLTIARNKLISFPGIENSTFNSTLLVGKSIFIQKVYNFAGVDPATGSYLYFNKNDNPTFTPSSANDKTVIIDLTPKYYGGFQNSMSYKNLQLDILFQFVKQMAGNLAFSRGSVTGRMNGNQTVSVLGRWKNPGDITNIQRYSTTKDASDAQGSDAGYSDASFIRLKNVSLSYQLGNSIGKKVNIQNARIFVQTQNLFTITKYQGLDPETKALSTLPTLRVITIGLQVGF